LEHCECDGFRFALRNPANPNAHAPGATFYGDPAIFGGDHISLDVVVPGAVWEIAAPAPSFSDSDGEYVQQRSIGYGLTGLITLLVSLLISTRALNRRLAMLDALTELPNRRYAFRRLASLAARHRRTGDQFGAVVVDVNGFKAINDNLGHVFGDELLTRCAAALRNGLRKGEEVSRIGGDEFLLILPNARSVADIDEVLERIDDIVAPPVSAPDGSAISLSVSAGGAVFGGDVDSVRQLLHIADSRMYEQKQVSHGTRPAPVVETLGDD
jgi:diguanylate cyclase (GGDEF)-like protein